MKLIFRTMQPRKHLMLELIARAGVRIDGVLKLTMNDIHDQKLRLRDPKSGWGYEYVFIPVKVAERLRKNGQICLSESRRPHISDFIQSCADDGDKNRPSGWYPFAPP